MRLGFNQARQRWEMWDDAHTQILFVMECPSEEELLWWQWQIKNSESRHRY